jgi:hypothetical protein
VLVAVIGVGVACSRSSHKASGLNKAAAASTTLASTTTTTPGSAVNPADVTTTDKVALGLNVSLLSASDVAHAMGLSPPPAPEVPGPHATPQGPLTEQGILSVLPDATVYRPLYERAHGGVGANVTYHVPSAKLDIDILAIKFANQQGAQSFVQQATNIATSLAQAKVTPHPELALGVLPAGLQGVLRVPPSPLTDPTHETILIDVVYHDGVDYVITLIAPPRTVTDLQMITLARAQDTRYRANKASIG